MNYLNIWLIGSFLLLIACSDKTNTLLNTPDNLQWNFSLDTKETSADSLYSYRRFCALFEASGSLMTDNIKIFNQKKQFYSFEQNLGDIILKRLAAGKYEILERYIIPVGSVYGKFALTRYVLDISNNSLQRDTQFIPQLGIYKYWSNHVVKEYDSYLLDTNYMSTSLDLVPHEALENIRFLMFNLTLAAVLEDCEPCRARMSTIETDFPMVNKKEYRQNKEVCQTILRKFLNN